MPWVKISDDFTDSPKLAAIEATSRPFAIELYIAALCYCGRVLTDGFVPRGQIGRLVDFEASDVDPYAIAAELVAAGLWETAETGYTIHDYLEYQPSREQVEAKRATTRARVTRWRSNAKCNAVTNAVGNAVSNAAPVPEPVPEPVKTRKPPYPPAGEAWTLRLNPSQLSKLTEVFGEEAVHESARRLERDEADGIVNVRSFHALLRHRLENPPAPDRRMTPDGVPLDEL